MCPGLWRKASSAPHPAQVLECFSVVPSVPLLHNPGPSFFPVFSPSHWPFFFFLRAVYLKALLGVPGFSTSAAAHGLCPPIPRPRLPQETRVIAAEPALYGRWPRGLLRPARSPWGSGQSCLAETSPLDFLGHLQIPSVVQDVRQPGTWRPRGHSGTEARRSGRV